MLACSDVLIVDDNRDAADSLAMLLRIFGYDVRIAYDAGTALDMARERSCHAVFIDLGMPGTDGYQLLPMLRGVTGMAEARLICLTGYGDEEHRLRAVGHGCDGYLIKPAEPDDLLAALSTACSTAIGA